MAGFATAYNAILGVGNTIQQVVSSNYDAGIMVITGRASASATPGAYFVAGSKPKVSLTSTDIEGTLNTFSDSVSTGVALASDTITIPFQERTTGGTFKSGSSHYSLTGTDAGLVVTSVDATGSGDGSNVTISVDCLFVSSDGETNPIASNISQALASSAFSGLWNMGAAYANSTLISCVTGWTVRPNLQMEYYHCDGNPFPTDTYIDTSKAIEPEIEVQFESIASANLFAGSYVAGTTAVVYARKRSAGGTLIAKGTAASHISFTLATAGIHDIKTISAGDGDNSKATVVLRGPTITISTSATVP